MESRSQNHEKLGNYLFWVDLGPKGWWGCVDLEWHSKNKMNGPVYSLVYRLPRLSLFFTIYRKFLTNVYPQSLCSWRNILPYNSYSHKFFRLGVVGETELPKIINVHLTWKNKYMAVFFSIFYPSTYAVIQQIPNASEA